MSDQKAIPVSITKMYQRLLARYQQDVARLTDEIVQLEASNEALAEQIREYSQRDQAQRQASPANVGGDPVAGGIDEGSDEGTSR